MKKVLFATTALVMTAGAAAAEVEVSGNARMGITNASDFGKYFVSRDPGLDDDARIARALAAATGDAADVAAADEAEALAEDATPSGIYTRNADGKLERDDNFRFTSRIRIVFTASGETDSGLSFGASIRADQAGIGNGSNGFNGTMMDAGTVYMSGAFGKITFGDNDSAANQAVGHVDGVGFTGLSDLNELGYLGHTDTSVAYMYNAGAFTGYLSMGQIDSDEYSAAVKYATDAFSVALGYEDTDVNDQWTLGASGSFGPATVKAVIADRESVDDTLYALSASGEFAGATVTAYYAKDNAGTFTTSEAMAIIATPGDRTATAFAHKAFGLGAAYDLGGGATVAGGIVRVNYAADVVEDETLAELGVKFDF